MVIIKTKKFLLRPFRMSDAPSLARNINDKTIYRNTSHIPHPYKLADAKKWLGRKKKNELNFAIIINNEVVGGVSLMKIEPSHKAEVGYWLARRHRGQGIMPIAVNKVLQYGFRVKQLKRVYAKVFCYNKSSARVLMKQGFKQEGYAKKEHQKDGKLIDTMLFAKVK